MAFAETTVAVVPTDPARGLRNYVVGFNAYGGTPGRWAVSTDGGARWTRHSELDPGFAWGPPAEAPNFSSYYVDPSLVLTSYPNQVAFVVIASAGGGPLQVANATSTDGGVHFGNVHLVSNPRTARRSTSPSRR